MKFIDKLTPEQHGAMSGWSEKWIKIGLCTEPADRPKFTRAAKLCYEFANIEWHGNVVWVSSPLVLAISAPVSATIVKHFTKYDGSGEIPAGEAVLKRAINRHLSPIFSRMITKDMRARVEEAVLKCILFQPIGENNVDKAMAEAVQNRTELFRDWYKYIGGQFWVGGYGWGASFMSFFRDVCDLELEGNLWERSKAYEETCESACWWWPHTHFLVVSERPKEIHLEQNPQGSGKRLHCETGPAISWPDGWGIYSWNGVVVPESWIVNRDQLDPNEVIKVTNVEQRAAGAQIVGLNKMLKVLNTKVIDDSGSDDVGQLIEMTLPGLERPGRFLKAKCPRNGTIVEGVPYVSDIDGLPIETALAAQAWRIGDPQSEYQHPPRRT